MIDPQRGVLYPERLPEFHRLEPQAALRDVVTWFWIPEWDLPDGVVSRQDVVSYPALNLVVEPRGVTLVGPTTTATHRELIGRGWAVGALLRPAAVAALIESPAALRDRVVPFDATDLHSAVAGEMRSAAEGHWERAAAAFSHWLATRVGEPGEAGRPANAMSDLLMTDAAVLRAEDAATRLAVSLRTLQRMAHRHVGLPPLAMIRRRRLQEAAQRLRDDPEAGIAEVAAELGYADHSHLGQDFRTVLGLAPSAYRAQVGDA